LKKKYKALHIIITYYGNIKGLLLSKLPSNLHHDF